MSGKKLSDSLQIGSLTLKNRICMPALVCFDFCVKKDGFATERNVEHYRQRARGGAGLIIQEATCVSPEGLLTDGQLGIWLEEQTEGHRRIAQAVHEQGGVILMQIHYAGVTGITQSPLCPSAYAGFARGRLRQGVEMSLADIRRVQGDFIAAARRAYQAGYDGVEVHGSHGYLISQFLNERVNKRSDVYGRQPMTFAAEIIRGIREQVPADFVIGMRLGGFEPDLAAGLRHAREAEALGVDYLNISYGFSEESDEYKPEGFPYSELIYAAQEIKKQVATPVFAVREINSPETAAGVIALTDVDMVAIGRGMLVDPDWANKALSGQTPNPCLHCKTCMWRIESDKCPGRLIAPSPQRTCTPG